MATVRLSVYGKDDRRLYTRTFESGSGTLYDAALLAVMEGISTGRNFYVFEDEAREESGDYRLYWAGFEARRFMDANTAAEILAERFRKHEWDPYK